MSAAEQFAEMRASASEKSLARWWQLTLGVIAMMSIASPQYVWTLFVPPFQAATHSSLPAVQITFSLLIVLQTWLAPLQGWLIDRFGPKFLIGGGAALSGLGYVLSAQANTVLALYLSYGALCGFGTGLVYIGIIGLMVRWFPDRRGFAVGLAAAGYGVGAIVTTFPIAAMLAHSGHRPTLIFFGIAFVIIVKVSPFSIRKEIEDDQNTALAILIGSVIIGIALIVAAAVHG